VLPLRHWLPVSVGMEGGWGDRSRKETYSDDFFSGPTGALVPVAVGVRGVEGDVGGRSL
jgi:hypothetical protein